MRLRNALLLVIALGIPIGMTAFGSGTGCSATGNGCSCQAVECNVSDAPLACLEFKSCFDSNSGCLNLDDDRHSFQTSEQVNATKCVSSGPLVGGGCTSGTISYCKLLRTCRCDAFGECTNGLEEEAGLYVPCQPLD